MRASLSCVGRRLLGFVVMPVDVCFGSRLMRLMIRLGRGVLIRAFRLVCSRGRVR